MQTMNYSKNTVGKIYLMSAISGKTQSCSKCKHNVERKKFKPREEEVMITTYAGREAKQIINGGPESRYAGRRCDITVVVEDDGKKFEIDKYELKFGINNCKNFERIDD